YTYNLISCPHLSHAFSSFSLPPLITLTLFFTDTPTTVIYTLSLHDALPISDCLYFYFVNRKLILTFKYLLSWFKWTPSNFLFTILRNVINCIRNIIKPF